MFGERCVGSCLKTLFTDLVVRIYSKFFLSKCYPTLVNVTGVFVIAASGHSLAFVSRAHPTFHAMYIVFALFEVGAHGFEQLFLPAHR